VSFAGLLLIQWKERRREEGPRAAAPEVRFPFSTPAAAAFILVTLAIIGSDLVYGSWRVRAGMVVVAAGIPMYHLWRRIAPSPVRA
jgi:hypothetical protein